ncbi:hypothetical protein O3G_MSEX014272 [Manduca sexta]|uniref:Uncharacterized protein n=2 Tax=Manduca sexta TaxID=7130 RepID=A0A921ZTD6_MANSE|nr:hypothetical protein O3G_MSEX014272 [Manduca sexta]KAG6464101.1 hypothetical protein O3G_MSEX014272 [Manduca sexta]
MMAEINKVCFERCCRLCAEEQDVTIMIFSAEAEAMLLQNKLNKYLLIEVDEDDRLPKNICIKCCSKLQTVCDFIDSAHRAQELLTNRSLMLDEVVINHCTITPIKVENDVEIINSDDDGKFTEMEISVDPMMVLQNSEEGLSPISYDNSTSMEDVTHLHGVDGENVTIKLIKKCEPSPDSSDEKDAIAKPFPCITCKRSFYSELALKNHSWIHTGDNKEKKYRCNTCMDIFDFKCDLVSHLKIQHKTNGQCQLCGRMFRSEKTYTAHMAVHASTGKSFTCKICGRSYKTWGSLRTHNITHSSERPYHCPFCKKTFKRNQDLKFHINQHTGAKPYKCPFCEKSFASSGNCYSHRSRMHPGRRVEGKVRRWNGTTKENPVLPSRTTAKTHLTNVKGIYKYQCQICEHSFLRRDNYTVSV